MFGKIKKYRELEEAVLFHASAAADAQALADETPDDHVIDKMSLESMAENQREKVARAQSEMRLMERELRLRELAMRHSMCIF